MLQVLIVNKKRYLINTESVSAEAACKSVLSRHDQDAIIDWENPTLKDVL